MAAEGANSDVIQAVALLAAGVVAVPVFKRLGLGSILGYLAAGVVIGPFGLGIFYESAGDPPRCRAWRGDVPVHHRAGDGAIASVEPAARDLRSRRCYRSACAARC